MPEPTSTSVDLMTPLLGADVAEDDLLYVGVVAESDPDDFNRGIEVAQLRIALLGRLFDFTIASGSKLAVPVSFGATLSPAPTRAGILAAMQTNADASVVGVELVPGSLSATGCEVRAKSDNHTGIKGTVVIRA